MEVDTALYMEMAAIAKQKPMKDIMSLRNSDIQKFYKNTTVFITGGTGFLGKQLIEKLLRSCSVSKMYVLLRSKRGVDVQSRLMDLLQDPVYETLREEQPDFENIIEAIDGDVSSYRLGINMTDWRTLINTISLSELDQIYIGLHGKHPLSNKKRNIKIGTPSRELYVDVIFHLAATTKFDETLRVATLINVRGTTEALRLAKACKILRSFVYVSTAYSHATKTVIDKDVDEKFYESPISPEALISLAENVGEDRVNGITSGLITNWPNTYTFTKAVAEEAIRTMSHGLPICIVRPGIVTASYREPRPGWLDINNVYGASGILVGSGIGLIHCVLKAKREVNPGFIPCDYVNNIIIAAARETANDQLKGGDDTTIYNVTSIRNKICTEKLEKYLLDINKVIPTPLAIYYNTVLYLSNILLFKIANFLLHTVPGYLLDIICLLVGKKQRFVKMYSKMDKMLNVRSYFILNEWNFLDNNVELLLKNMKEDDQIIFNFDVTAIDWKEYACVWILGIRKYIFKDGLINTEYAKKKQFWLRILHYVVMVIYSCAVGKILHLIYKIGILSLLLIK